MLPSSFLIRFLPVHLPKEVPDKEDLIALNFRIKKHAIPVGILHPKFSKDQTEERTGGGIWLMCERGAVRASAISCKIPF
jgi:hypothetical protein